MMQDSAGCKYSLISPILYSVAFEPAYSLLEVVEGVWYDWLARDGDLSSPTLAPIRRDLAMISSVLKRCGSEVSDAGAQG